MTTREDLLLEEWKMASELHRHEDNLTWNRFSYFVTLTGVLLPIFGALALQTDVAIALTARFASLLVAFFGATTSVAWTLMQIRSKLYHQYRVAQARSAEKRLLVNGERVLTIYEANIDQQALIRVHPVLRKIIFLGTHNMIIFFSGLVTIIWIILFVIGLSPIGTWV